VKDNSPLDATGNDGGVPVDATGDDVDEPSDAPGNDGGEHVVDATGDDIDEPLDAPGDDGGEHVVDATGDDVDEALDAPGDDGGQHVDATSDDVLDDKEPLDSTGNEDDGNKQVDATGDDGGQHVDASTGDDGDKQVDGATGDEGDNDNVSNDGNNRFVCTIVNHPGPCGWKIAHQCICEDYEVPIQCKGNVNESCLRLVHPECMRLWERVSSSAITPLDPSLQFNLVCPMHHPQFQKSYKSDMPYLKQRNHPSPMNRQTLTQPPTSNETAKPNENDSSYSSPSDSSTSSSNSNRDQSQSSNSKKKGTAELLSENKETSPMIKGMDVMESEAAKYKFEREKNKYSCSEHLERFRQIQISRGMDPTHAVPLAKKNSSSDSSGSSSSSSDSSSDSSGSSSSSSAVGTDSSNKTPVAKIVLPGDDDDVDITDFVDHGGGMKATIATKAMRVMTTTRRTMATTTPSKK
jgi:hypothetical protein